MQREHVAIEFAGVMLLGKGERGEFVLGGCEYDSLAFDRS